MVEGKLIRGEKSEAAGRAWSELCRLCLRRLFHKIYRTIVQFSIRFYFVLWNIKYLSIACYHTIRGDFVMWPPFRSWKQQIWLKSFNMALSRKFPMSLNTSLIKVLASIFLFGNPLKFLQYKPQILYVFEIVLYSKFDPARSKLNIKCFQKQ